MLACFGIVTFYPEWKVLAKAAFLPCKKKDFVFAVVINIAGQKVLYLPVCITLPDCCPIFIGYFKKAIIKACLQAKNRCVLSVKDYVIGDIKRGIF